MTFIGNLFADELDEDIYKVVNWDNPDSIATAFYTQALRHLGAQKRALQWMTSEGILLAEDDD